MRTLRNRASRSLARWLAVIGLAALAVGPVMAQSNTGGFTVLVLDENDDPLPGATVVLSSTQRKVATTAELTNKKGQVRFPVLAAGSGYVIEVSFPGYGTQQREVSVKINGDELIRVKLAEEFTEEVKVIAEAEVVELEKTRTSTKFSDDFIGDLPVAGRFYTNVLTLAPGVQDADGDGTPNVHGSRARDFKTLVSGVSNVDPLTGKTGGQLNMDAIEEIEVITAGAGPEFGRAQGGFANIIQKQGSNEFEGVVSFLYQSSKLDGDGAGNTPRLDQPEFQSYRPSFQVSGPILRDKLWYRLSHDYENREDPVNIVNSVEVQNFERLISSDQITWQVSDRNKLAFRYDAAPFELSNFGISSQTPSASTHTYQYDFDNFSLTWEAPYSPQIYVKTLAAYTEYGVTLDPTTAGVGNNCVGGDPFFANANCFDAETGLVSGSNPLTYDDDRTRFTLRADATMYPRNEWLGMSHQFDFGFIVENERFELTDDRRASLTFFKAQTFNAQGVPEDQVGQVVTTFRVPPMRTDTASGATVGLYVKDQMKPRQNITLEIGARVDREVLGADGITSFDPRDEYDDYIQLYNQLRAQGIGDSTAQQQARVAAFTTFEDLDSFKNSIAILLCGGQQSCSQVTDELFRGAQLVQGSFQSQSRRPRDIHIENTNVSPFLAFSWDPWSNGKTKVALSAGRYYNNIPLLVPTRELSPVTTSVTVNATQEGGGWVVPPLIDGLDVNGQISPAPSINVVDRGLRTPYQDEFSLTFERELWTETALSVTYVKRDFYDQIQDVDINNVPGDFSSCDPNPAAGSDGLLRPLQPDGILDDCSGRRVYINDQGGGGGGSQNPSGPNANVIPAPDGFPDLFTRNPFWGPIYLIGNYNEINYDGVVLELRRRQYRGWEMQGSYTYSVAEGNGEDFFQPNGDDLSNYDDEFGYQSYDQRHVVKWQGTKVSPWGVRLGAAVTWQSGLPYSVLRRRLLSDVPAPTLSFGSGFDPRTRNQYPTGQRNDARNTSYWNVDLRATREFAVGSKMNVQLSVDVFNVFNDGTYVVYNPDVERGEQINGTNDARRRFGRQWQLSARVSF